MQPLIVGFTLYLGAKNTVSWRFSPEWMDRLVIVFSIARLEYVKLHWNKENPMKGEGMLLLMMMMMLMVMMMMMVMMVMMMMKVTMKDYGKYRYQNLDQTMLAEWGMVRREGVLVPETPIRDYLTDPKFLTEILGGAIQNHSVFPILSGYLT